MSGGPAGSPDPGVSVLRPPSPAPFPLTAIEFLQAAAEPKGHSVGRTRVVVAYGILWAEASARIDGTLALALQRASAEAGQALLSMALEAGVQSAGEVPRWLRRHREAVLRILA